MSNTALAQLLLDSTIYRFHAIKDTGDKAIAQLERDEDFHRALGPESNSIATIVQHLYGNMRSRWTDFLTSDGEKPWRDRDGEFEADTHLTRGQVIELWNEGWRVTLEAIEALKSDDLERNVVIRGQEINVIDALQRQLVHYGYHLGQIVQLARHCKGDAWQSLSIPRGESRHYKPVKRD